NKRRGERVTTVRYNKACIRQCIQHLIGGANHINRGTGERIEPVSRRLAGGLRQRQSGQRGDIDRAGTGGVAVQRIGRRTAGDLQRAGHGAAGQGTGPVTVGVGGDHFSKGVAVGTAGGNSTSDDGGTYRRGTGQGR